jgi:actin-like ATPase involved in cell morphogenesis
MFPPGFGLGIDYGTSNTVALMRWPDGRVKPLLFEGSPVLPSAVFAPAEGALVVGRDALHHARFAPARLEPNPKRRIDDETVLLGDREVPLVDLVAATLRHIADEAVRVTGGAFPQVALAHPAGWGPVRRGVLVDAARTAGLGEVRLVPEPIAAAQYYIKVFDPNLPIGRPVVVYDLGGGTFDGSVVARRAAGIDVLVVDGITDVGGLDIDAMLVDWLAKTVGAQHPDDWARLASPTTTADQQLRRTLWEDVRAAKEMLSRVPAVLIQLPQTDIDARLTRDEFEAAVEPLLARTVRTTTALIRHAQLNPAEVAGILLVGGSSRIPLVATLLHRATGIAPAVAEQPELIVAEGALQSIERPAATVPAASPVMPTPISAAPVATPGYPTGPISPAPVSSSYPIWSSPTSSGFPAAPTAYAPPPSPPLPPLPSLPPSSSSWKPARLFAGALATAGIAAVSIEAPAIYLPPSATTINQGPALIAVLLVVLLFAIEAAAARKVPAGTIGALLLAIGGGLLSLSFAPNGGGLVYFLAAGLIYALEVQIIRRAPGPTVVKAVLGVALCVAAQAGFGRFVALDPSHDVVANAAAVAVFTSIVVGSVAIGAIASGRWRSTST